MECREKDELQMCIVEGLLINCHSQNKDIRKGTFNKDGYIEWEDGTYWLNEGIENKKRFPEIANSVSNDMMVLIFL